MACYIFNNKRYTEEEIIKYLQDNPQLLNTAAQPLIEQLQKGGLADAVYQLTTEEINQKLEELGVSEDVRKQVIAWHGSPNYFKQFLLDRIGTGKGAQAFGWGLYFTDLESIARKYARMGERQKVTYKGEMYDYFDGITVHRRNREYLAVHYATNVIQEERSQQQAIPELKKRLSEENKLKKRFKEQGLNYEVEYSNNKIWAIKKAITLIENDFDSFSIPEINRNLYKTTIHKGKQPSEYTWLEWDKKFSELPQNTREALLKLQEVDKIHGTAVNLEVKDYTIEHFYKMLSQSLGSPQAASLFLLENGIDGIKYPAETISRGATSDTARGFNYVVFDENAITIEEHIQFQKELSDKGVSLTPNGFTINNEVYLNKDTMGLDTPVHELAHLYNKALKQDNPELYQRGIDLVNQELAKETSEIQEVIDYVRQTQPNLQGEALAEEILTELTGRRGIDLLAKGQTEDSTIMSWIRQALEYIKNLLGLSQMSNEQAMNLTLQEYADAVAVDLLRGEELKFENETQAIKEISKDKLLAVHNLSIPNLLNVDKQGGLAVPSLAVINTDHPFTSFGEITLVADKSLIDPKESRLNKAFAADSYSVRYPSIIYTPNPKKLREFNERVKKELPYLDERDSFRNVDDRGRVDVENDNVTKLLFLKEQGKEKDFVFRESEIPDKYLDRFEKLLEKTRDSFDFTREGGKVYQEFSEIIKEKAVEELRQGNLEEFEFNSLLPVVSKVSSNDYYAFRKSLNARKNKELNVYKTLDKNQVDVNSEEYQNFVDEIYDNLEVTERIFKGYTPSGIRRYVPHTIENVVRMMKGGARGGEGFFYGVGSVRAGIVKQFKSIKDIKDSQDKIVSSEEFEKVKEEINNEFLELGEKLRPFYKYQTDSFGYFDNVGESLIEFYNRGRSQDFNELDKETEQEVKDFLEKLYNLPTEYFEVKIERAVDLSEFKGALIPKNTPRKVRNILESKGLKVVEYSEKIDYNEFADLRFQNQTEAQQSFFEDSDFDQNGNVRPEVVQEIEQEKAEIIRKAQSDGTWMKAPNGKPTNLNEEQWVLVRTKRFKDWFGDWQNDPENASKVVDENGEPLVLNHGTRTEFTVFGEDSSPSQGTYLKDRKGFFFAKEDVAEGYGSGIIISGFLNIKNPNIVDVISRLSELDFDYIEERQEAEEYGYPITRWLGEGLETFEANDSATAYLDDNMLEVMDDVDSNSNDGVIVYGADGSITTVVFDSNQIKSATDNIGTFSNQRNDIRFQIIGEQGASHVENPLYDVLSEVEQLDNASDVINNPTIESLSKNFSFLIEKDLNLQDSALLSRIFEVEVGTPQYRQQIERSINNFLSESSPELSPVNLVSSKMVEWLSNFYDNLYISRIELKNNNKVKTLHSRLKGAVQSFRERMESAKDEVRTLTDTERLNIVRLNNNESILPTPTSQLISGTEVVDSAGNIKTIGSEMVVEESVYTMEALSQMYDNQKKAIKPKNRKPIKPSCV